ncbi:hypothetical protein D3C86_1909480 [compost metagenome]
MMVPELSRLTLESSPAAYPFWSERTAVLSLANEVKPVACPMEPTFTPTDIGRAPRSGERAIAPSEFALRIPRSSNLTLPVK